MRQAGDKPHYYPVPEDTARIIVEAFKAEGFSDWDANAVVLREYEPAGGGKVIAMTMAIRGEGAIAMGELDTNRVDALYSFGRKMARKFHDKMNDMLHPRITSTEPGHREVHLRKVDGTLVFDPDCARCRADKEVKR